MIQQTANKLMESGTPEIKLSIGVAMSGGVDSSVTAKLLKNMGHDVQGFFMSLAQPDLAQQIARVKTVASHLAIPLTIVDLAAEFREKVLDYFSRSYLLGKTPNPCIICNPLIKFGRLLETILAAGCERMATGHYARIVRDRQGMFHLLKGVDPGKDQSYFLHRLTRKQLAFILMPLGGQMKENVYRMAAELGISGVHGAESQDVCFLKGRDLSSFISLPAEDTAAGPILSLDGHEIGKHHGIHCFTVGQRKGLGIPDATPYYVVALDSERNAVIIGKKEDLLRQELDAGDVNWLAGREPELPGEFHTRIRYRHKGAPAMVKPEGNGVYRVRFHEPQLAVTPGQFAVFYHGEEVMGGGVIL